MKRKYRLARFLKRYLPKEIGMKWDHYLMKSFEKQTTNSKENRRRMEEFQLQQITIAFWGFFFCLFMTIGILILTHTSSQISFLRNSFGEGEKEIALRLKEGKQSEDITLILEEQQLSKEEENKVFQSFFQELKPVLCGENVSLSKVNKPLCFVEELDGYPFYITYQPEDPGVIDWNGEPGEEAAALKKGKTLHTNITVEASYKQYEATKRFYVTVIPLEKEKLSLLEAFQNKLLKKEERSRSSSDFVIEQDNQAIHVSEVSKSDWWKLPILFLTALILYLIRGYSLLREEEKIRHKENMEDFPLIVHLLTLYMGAGLSFPSAVERVSEDYEKNKKPLKERYAFEQIRVMNHLMHMGVRPKEACLAWGNHFKERPYMKFAMLLAQGFSKGSKEIRSMMEKEEQEAFQVQVDFVRREGEEASTRLLFPMIVLLCFIMILVMFPAMIQFYGL